MLWYISTNLEATNLFKIKKKKHKMFKIDETKLKDLDTKSQLVKETH